MQGRVARAANSPGNRMSNVRQHSIDIPEPQPAHFWKEQDMNITLSIGPLIALIAGILILVMPRLLNFIVALYLIIIGVLGLFGAR
jgi:hypothetical protein